MLASCGQHVEAEFVVISVSFFMFQKCFKWRECSLECLSGDND